MSRVALITGSATGLGVQTVHALARDGHQVMIAYRTSQKKAEQLQQVIQKQYGVQADIIQGDVTLKEDCQRMVEETVQRIGRLDILINNAGPYIFERKKIISYTDEEWEQMISGNLSAVFYLCRAAVPIMRKQGWGRIVNFGFNQSAQAPSWMYRGPFASAKVGLVSLTKTLAEEEAPSGITVNMICPGDIKGEDKEKSITEVKYQSELKHQSSAFTSGTRLGSGEDIGRLAAFLCAEQSDFVTGSVIEVNGGLNVLAKSIEEEKRSQ